MLIVVECPVDVSESLDWMKEGELFVKGWKVKIAEVEVTHAPPYKIGELIGLRIEADFEQPKTETKETNKCQVKCSL